MTTAFKVYLNNNDVRRFSASCSSFSEFVQNIKSLYASELTSDFEVRYVDSDGDKVKVTSDLEWQEMFRELSSQPIKLYIERCYAQAKTAKTTKRDKKKKTKQTKQETPKQAQVPPRDPSPTSETAPKLQQPQVQCPPSNEASESAYLESLVAPLYDVVPFFEAEVYPQLVTCYNTLMTPEYQQNLISGVGHLAGAILTDPAKLISDFFTVETNNVAQPKQNAQSTPTPQQPVQPKPQVQEQTQVQKSETETKQPEVKQPEVKQAEVKQSEVKNPEPKPEVQLPPSKHLAALKQLRAMGFTELNELNALLDKYNGDVAAVVTRVLG